MDSDRESSFMQGDWEIRARATVEGCERIVIYARYSCEEEAWQELAHLRDLLPVLQLGNTPVLGFDLFHLADGNWSKASIDL